MKISSAGEEWVSGWIHERMENERVCMLATCIWRIQLVKRRKYPVGQIQRDNMNKVASTITRMCVLCCAVLLLVRCVTWFHFPGCPVMSVEKVLLASRIILLASVCCRVQVLLRLLGAMDSGWSLPFNQCSHAAIERKQYIIWCGLVDLCVFIP